MNPLSSLPLELDYTAMVAYRERAEERLSEWQNKKKEMQRMARVRGVDATAAFRELERRVRRDIARADDACMELDRAGMQEWFAAKSELERAWEALDDLWMFWLSWQQP